MGCFVVTVKLILVHIPFHSATAGHVLAIVNQSQVD